MKHEFCDTSVRCAPRTPSCCSSRKLLSSGVGLEMTLMWYQSGSLRPLWQQYMKSRCSEHRHYTPNLPNNDTRGPVTRAQGHGHPLYGGAFSPESPLGRKMKSSHFHSWSSGESTWPGQHCIAAITRSGDVPSLLRRLARISGTTWSWGGTPKPPLNQVRKADRTVRSSHFRYLADAGARASLC